MTDKTADLIKAANHVIQYWQSNTNPPASVRHALMSAIAAHEQQQNELLNALAAQRANLATCKEMAVGTAMAKHLDGLIEVNERLIAKAEGK